jgi:hypothetical protein
MADSKITALAANTTPAAADLLVMVDDVAGTPVTMNITMENFFKVIESLTADTSPSTDDLVAVLNDPASADTPRKVTLGAVAALAKLGNFSLNAGGMWPSTTSGAAAAAKAETTTNDLNYYAISFPDSGGTTYAETQIIMPSDYNGGTFTAKFYWLATGTSTNSVRWTIEARSFGDLETLDQAFGTAVAVDDAHSATASQVQISAATAAVTPAGTPAGGELMAFKIGRASGHANDTLAVAALLLGVAIIYTRS